MVLRLLFYCTIFLSSSVLYSQSQEVGLSLQFLDVRGTRVVYSNTNNNPRYESKEVESDLTFLNLKAAQSFIFARPSNEFSIGMQLGIGIGTSVLHSSDKGSPTGPAFMFDPSTYVVFQYGAGATHDAFKRVGLGLGLGYEFNVFIMPSGEGVLGTDNFDYGRPSVFLECNFGGPRIKVKVEKQFGQHDFSFGEFQGFSQGYSFDTYAVSMVFYRNVIHGNYLGFINRNNRKKQGY